MPRNPPRVLLIQGNPAPTAYSTVSVALVVGLVPPIVAVIVMVYDPDGVGA